MVQLHGAVLGDGVRGRGGDGCWAGRGRAARHGATPLRIAGLGCPEGCWYNRSIHELTLVDHAGAVRPATGFFVPLSMPQISLIAKRKSVRAVSQTIPPGRPGCRARAEEALTEYFE